MKRTLNIFATVAGIAVMSGLSGCAGTSGTASTTHKPATTVGLYKPGTSFSDKPDMWAAKGLTPPGGRQ